MCTTLACLFEQHFRYVQEVLSPEVAAEAEDIPDIDAVEVGEDALSAVELVEEVLGAVEVGEDHPKHGRKTLLAV